MYVSRIRTIICAGQSGSPPGRGHVTLAHLRWSDPSRYVAMPCRRVCDNIPQELSGSIPKVYRIPYKGIDALFTHGICLLPLWKSIARGSTSVRKDTLCVFVQSLWARFESTAGCRLVKACSREWRQDLFLMSRFPSESHAYSFSSSS